MSIDAVILCSFMSIFASHVIFSLFPLPRGSANLNLFGRESKTQLWFYAETLRQQKVALIKIYNR